MKLNISITVVDEDTKLCATSVEQVNLPTTYVSGILGTLFTKCMDSIMQQKQNDDKVMIVATKMYDTFVKQTLGMISVPLGNCGVETINSWRRRAESAIDAVEFYEKSGE